MTRPTTSTRRGRRFILSSALAGGAFALLVPAPAAAQVTSVGTINSTVGNGAGATSVVSAPSDVTVTLGNSRTILNWQSLNVSSNQTLNFVFGGNNNAVLNRVFTGTTTINGNLNAYLGAVGGASGGQVFIINTNGVIFGANANVNVGGLVASTLDLTDADFLDGNSSYNFTGATTGALTVVSGSRLTSTNGSLILVAGAITSSGALSASGDVALVTASDVTVNAALGSPLSMTVARGSTINGGIVAGGTAAGQNIYLAAVGRSGIASALLNVTGAMTATGATAIDRGIVLTSGESATGITVETQSETPVAASISVGGALSSQKNVEIRSNENLSGSGSIAAAGAVSGSATGNLSLGAVDAGGDIDLAATKIGNRGQDLDLASNGNITLSGPVIGVDVALAAGGSVTTGTISARDDIQIRAVGAVQTGDLASFTTIETLAPGDVSGAADLLAGGPISGGDTNIAGNSIQTGSVIASGANSDVRLAAGTGGIGSGSNDLVVRADGQVRLSGSARGRDIVLTSGGILSTDSLTARDDLLVTSAATAALGNVQTGVTVDGLAAIDVAGAAEAANGGLNIAGQDIRLQSGSGLNLTSASSSGSSSDLTINGPINNGGQALTLTAGGNLDVAGTATVGSATLVAGQSLFTRNTLSASGGNITLTAGQNVTAASLLTTGTGDIRITAGNLLSAESFANWLGRDLYLSAADFGSGSLSAATLQESRNLSVVDRLGGLTISAATGLSAAADLTVQTLNGGGLSVGGVSAGGSITLQSAGDLTVSDTVTATGDPVTATAANGNLTFMSGGRVIGSDVVLSTSAAFVNNRGADAVTASGRWLVYSASPQNNVFGGLDSGNTALWNGTLATRAPGTVSGNRYIFAMQPTLTFTPLSTSKTYGTVLTSSAFTVGGFQQGVAGAFLADTAATAYSGAPVLNSIGYAERASVAGGPYAISIGAGSLASSAGYSLAFGGPAQLTVDPKSITGTATVANKTYDGTVAATGSVALNGVLNGDNVGATASYVFVDKNAGTNKAITVSGAALTGADAGNYTLVLTPGTVADILAKMITGNVSVASKTYDGTTAASGSVTLNGVVAGDSVNGSATYAFADKNAGTGKTVNVSGGTLSGADAANYTLTLPATVLADILKKALTGNVSVANKTYDGTTNATGSVTLNGVVAGDTVSGSANYAFADKNAGTGKTVNVSAGTLSGADAGNYTLTLPATVLADILKKALTGNVSVANKTYDGTTNASGSVTLNGVVAGDSVNGSATYAFADKNAGTGKTVNVSAGTLSGADAGNYTLTLPATVLADILQRALSIAADNQSKDKGEADPALTYTLTGGSLIAGDSLTGALSRTPGEEAGGYQIGQGSLTAGGNYTIAFANGTFTITADPRPMVSVQPLRATALPAQLRRPSKGRSPVRVDPSIFCTAEEPCEQESAR